MSSSLRKSDYSLACVFTDTTLCHRFIRVLIPESKRERAEEAINEFLRDLYEQEAGIIRHSIQEDEDINKEPSGEIASSGREGGSQNLTINILADPQKNSPPINYLRPLVKGNYEYVSGVPHSSKNTIGA